MIRRWANGKDAAIDATVTSPLAASNVVGAAAKAGSALEKACQRNLIQKNLQLNSTLRVIGLSSELIRTEAKQGIAFFYEAFVLKRHF